MDKIHELLRFCLMIQEGGEGRDGYPYVSFQTSNYGTQFEISIMDNGFKKDTGYDGMYEFQFDHMGERTYKNCKEHLQDLIRKVSYL